ncbi:MAG TPA: cupredoxin domain-containing protein [Jatrophihabitantaceae bacterium]|nr:cupredoxin domain-containing protein [Jatrophihabitantaceae bacterium]
MSRALTLGAGLSAAVLATTLTACSSSGSGGGSGIAVKAGDDSCHVAKTSLDAGKVTFKLKNTGSRVTEVYVYGRNGDAFNKVISEVENIGPGTSRDMTVTLNAGTYEVACKPGQKGNGIRTRITVAGGDTAPSALKSSDDAKSVREIELHTDGSTITGLSGSAGHATKGERIEFVLENGADGPRTLEIKKPSGAVADEVDIVKSGKGELTVELTDAGTWKVIVEGGASDLTADLVVS